MGVTENICQEISQIPSMRKTASMWGNNAVTPKQNDAQMSRTMAGYILQISSIQYSDPEKEVKVNEFVN